MTGLHIEMGEPAMFGDPVQWAVATLDDGSQIRMRVLDGETVEIRTWDETLDCNPPELVLCRLGRHTLDVSPGERLKP